MPDAYKEHKNSGKKYLKMIDEKMLYHVYPAKYFAAEAG
eukprot:gene13415-3935_t